MNGWIASTAIFADDEDEEVGRSFSAMRLVRDFSTQNLGLLVTNVERPYLDRKAAVLGVDHNWRPTARWNVRTRLIGSEVEQRGQNISDTGATIWADYEMDHGWRQQWIGMHFGNDLLTRGASRMLRQWPESLLTIRGSGFFRCENRNGAPEGRNFKPL